MKFCHKSVAEPEKGANAPLINTFSLITFFTVIQWDLLHWVTMLLCAWYQRVYSLGFLPVSSLSRNVHNYSGLDCDAHNITSPVTINKKHHISSLQRPS